MGVDNHTKNQTAESAGRTGENGRLTSDSAGRTGEKGRLSSDSAGFTSENARLTDGNGRLTGENAGQTGESVIQAARRGDQSALRDLYESTKNYAWFIAKRYVQNERDAEDVLQESYITAFLHLENFEDGKPFKPWLHKIITNKCIDYIRQKKVVLVPVDEVADLTADDEDTIPSEWLERAERRRDVIRIVDALPPGQRMAVTLFYFENLSLAETAEIMGVAAGTVKSHLAYGRKRIKEAVAFEEKKGNKLYTLAPIPLLSQLFELEAEAAIMPEATAEAVWSGVISSVRLSAALFGAGATVASGAAGGVVWAVCGVP